MIPRRRRPPKPVEPWKGPKPKLQMQVNQQYRVRDLDLQAYLEKVYKIRGYEIIRAVGGADGLGYEYLVTSKLPAVPNIQQQCDNIRRGWRTRNLSLILNVLCVDGFIPAGHYTISIKVPRDPMAEYIELLNDTHDPNDPECVSYRNTHKDPEFQRRARDLDHRMIEHLKKLEQQ